MDFGSLLFFAVTALRMASSMSCCLLVQVAVLDPPGDPGLVALHADDHTAVHRDGQRLAPPMPPSPAVSAIVPARDPPNRLAAIAANVS